MAKTFQVGEVVLFQRETGVSIPWELGEYMGADGDTGWHRVRDDTGFRARHYIPARRIKHSPAPRREGVLKSSPTPEPGGCSRCGGTGVDPEVSNCRCDCCGGTGTEG